MGKKKPRRGEAAQRVESGKCLNNTYPKPEPAKDQPIDCAGLRNRLCGARRRLLERLGDDWAEDRRFPDSAWSRLLADVEICIQAVDAQAAEDQP